MPRSTTSKSKEVEKFLQALERQARHIIKLSEKAAAEANKHSYEVYNKFRDKVSEFETFSIVIETRLRGISGEKADELQSKFDQLSILMFNHFIKTSIKFFFILSASTNLPLGAREIFMSELRRIYNAKQKLEEPRFSSAIDEEVKMNLDLAEDILNEIIEKAPGLLNFSGTMPSDHDSDTEIEHMES